MKNRAFLPLMEQIITIGIFAIVAALCIGCFVVSRNISLSTEAKDTAVILAQNAAENIKQNGLEEDSVYTSTVEGEEYTVSLQRNNSQTDILGSATISIFKENDLIFELNVCWQEDEQ